MKIVLSAITYFAMIFGAGFLLGPIRVLMLEPRVGVRVSELIEAPIMLLAILVIGRWIGCKQCRLMPIPSVLGVGLLTAMMILTADVAVGVILRGMTIVDVFVKRDAVAGPVYFVLVALTAVTPWAFRITSR
jgi:hypothetical protein